MKWSDLNKKIVRIITIAKEKNMIYGDVVGVEFIADTFFLKVHCDGNIRYVNTLNIADFEIVQQLKN